MDQRLNPENVAFFWPSLVLLLQNVVDRMFRAESAIPLTRGMRVDEGQVHETLVNMNTTLCILDL